MVQLPQLPVQCLECITVFRTFDDDLMTGQQIVVKSMHRLAVFFHNIVRNINDIVDRADAAGGQAALHPFGRGPDLDVFYDAGTIAGAKVRVLYFISPNRRILRQDINSQFRRVRIHVPVRTQLFDGAHHAIGINPAELALFDTDPVLRKRPAVMASSHLSAV